MVVGPGVLTNERPGRMSDPEPQRYNVPVNPRLRLAAAFLLAVMLPIQAWAAACAQICAIAQHEHEEAIAGQADHGTHPGAGADLESPVSNHCHDSEMGAGKCCQFHAFMVDLPVAATVVSVPPFERHFFVARWTSYIPEEPSPPPIASSLIA